MPYNDMLTNANVDKCTKNFKEGCPNNIPHKIQTHCSLLGLKQMMEFFCHDFSKIIRVPFIWVRV